jgi:aryl-alcohol dehydrogenase-like predicted oxidoreductase
MNYKHLRGLDIKLSNIGLGGEQLGGYSWGKVSQKEMIGVIHKAIDNGINLFDTAPIYGLGYSEEQLGATLGNKRRNVIIATKVGLIWRKGEIFEKSTDSSPANIRKEIDMSLKRLKTDYIDIYQIHWPDFNTPIEDSMATMENLKKSGKIRCIGCCNFPLSLLEEALKYAQIGTAQMPYSLIDKEVENGLLSFCRENGIGVLVYSPLGRGLLSGKYGLGAKFDANDNRSRHKYFQEELAKNLMVMNRVKIVAERLSKTSAQIAIRWVLENDCVTSAICGAKNAAQIEENAAASDFALSGNDMAFLSKGYTKSGYGK